MAGAPASTPQHPACLANTHQWPFSTDCWQDAATRDSQPHGSIR
ncbi:hypothetical protein E2C01_089152 [Portunus trituberculatus]|uniref:Uncharacterized protein n=1 Tax=Portunus trituberculatus TaxID=210409 RepID=A0A5B7JCR3_PORTR|nr:hypothetical protein [Portunus trituberculatus]